MHAPRCKSMTLDVMIGLDTEASYHLAFDVDDLL